MTPECNVRDSQQAGHATSGPQCQTDSTGRSASYASSRFNACTWQSRRDDIMICRGDRCRYKFCDVTDGEITTPGSLCSWETSYANLLANQFREALPPTGAGRYLDDYSHWLSEYVVAHLLSNRVAVRMSRSMDGCETAIDPVTGVIDRRPFELMDLTDRYMAAAHHRLDALYEHLTEVREQARADRIIAKMIEYGYWRPHDGDPRPDAVDAPDWIVRLVDTESGRCQRRSDRKPKVHAQLARSESMLSGRSHSLGPAHPHRR